MLAVLRASGLSTPEALLDPTAQVVAAPGVVETEFSWLTLPGCGLGTVAHDVPFQIRVRVCGCDAPGGV